jgi:hypothetical protein
MSNEPYLIFGTASGFLNFHRYRQIGKLNSYTSMEISVSMSYDSRNIVNRFLRLNRLNSSMNYLPSIIPPYQILPPSLIQKNREGFVPRDIINKIPDLPNTSAMGTELLNDLVARQEEFLKRIRKHPQDLMTSTSEYETEKK